MEKKRTAVKASLTKYEECKAKDRMRKRQVQVHSLSNLSSLKASSSPNNSYPASNLLVKQRLELQGAYQKVQERKKQF